jgi:putative ABC transport system permease protein
MAGYVRIFMLELRNITKTYKTAEFTQVALDHVSVCFRDNEFVAVLGPSGSGKTTMLNILGGLDRSDSGEIIVNGVSTKNFNSKDWDTYRNHRIGFIFQSYNLIPHQSVLSNVELALTLSGIGQKERRERAKRALAEVGLSQHINKKPSQLSGGQMQRVAIARALVNDPDIVLADEPTGALDTQTSVQVMDILKKVAQDRLVVMVTHNPELAERYATRIVRVRDGHIEGDSQPYDPAAELAEKPLDDAHEKAKGKHASMSFLTALGLSGNNLWSKKGRTILTAFAGSIGIIGIAAILALSNGVNNYIAKTEQDALSGYPLTITQGSADIASLMGMSNAGDNGDTDEEDSGSDIKTRAVVSDMFSEVRKNDLASFKTYLDSGVSGIEDHSSTIAYKYGIVPHIYASNTEDGVVRLGSPLSSGSNDFMQASQSLGLSYSNANTGFEELLDDQDLLNSQYDVMAGHWPESYDEAVLVLDSDGGISDYTLYCLGVNDPKELKDYVDSLSSSEKTEIQESANLSYQDALNLTFKVVNPAATYQYNQDTGIWTDMAQDDNFMKNMLQDATTLKVVGVVKPNETTQAASLQEGVAYTHELTQRLMAQASESEIVKEQLENPGVDVFTGKSFDELRSEGGTAFDMSQIFSVDENALQQAFSFNQDAIADAFSGESFDLSSLENADLGGADLSNIDLSGLDTSALSSIFTPDAVMALMQDAPLPDLRELAQSIDPAQLDATTDAASRFSSGFVGFVVRNLDTYQTVDDTGAVSFDMAAALRDFTTQDEEGVALYNTLVAAASSDAENIEPAVRSALEKYATDELAPYLSQRMSVLMQQAAEVMTTQLTQALNTQISSAAGALGSNLSTALSDGISSQMSNLTSALQDAFSVNADAFRDAIHFNLTQDDLTSLLTNYANASQLTYENNLATLGYADEANPHEIDIYPRSFEDKDEILQIIDTYNDEQKAQGADDKVISYTDLMGTLLSSVTDIVNTVSLVLIAFVSISLVVSSIMIAIITYISVIERKKEIGILRAMGASKLNIANIFNAETIIEGLVSGVFAIVVVLIASVPINNFVYSWRHVANIMALSPANALILIVISVVLTLLAGLIPSSIAARRDPVEALRSE